MKQLVTILGSMLIAATVFAGPAAGQAQATQKQKTLQKLANLQVQSDIRTVIKFDKEVGYCGNPAPSYIIEIQVKKFDKVVVKEDQGPELVERWETIKQYAISESELGQGGFGALPMDSERCL